VVAGDTDLVPVFDTVPIAWSMDTDVAPLTVHDSVELLSEAIEVGLAVKLLITGGPEGLTVIVDVIVDVPVSLTAVIVYVVVSVGATVFDPVADTLPMVGLMETVVAPETFQDSVVD